MRVYVSKNKTVRLKSYPSNNAGVEVIKGIRWTCENDPVFKAEYERQLNNPNYKKERTERSIRRTRQDIQEILNANLDNERCYFLTLTFTENIQDYKKANEKFKYFINKKNKDVKYLCVKEHQKRGAIHYHLIIFDIDYKDVKKIQSSWIYGKVTHLKKITDVNPWSIANYMSKYFIKENQRVKAGYRIFTKSQNLKKPLIISAGVVDKILLKYNYDIDLEAYDWLQHDYIIEYKPKYDLAVDFIKSP